MYPTKETRLYKTWLEDYEVNEEVHSRSVSHIRDGEGSYEYQGSAAGGGSGNGSQDPSSSGGKGGKGGKPNKPKPNKVPQPKKAKTEDQLARAAL